MTIRLLYQWVILGLLSTGCCHSSTNRMFTSSALTAPVLIHNLQIDNIQINNAQVNNVPADNPTTNTSLTPHSRSQTSSLNTLNTVNEARAVRVGLQLMGAPLAYVESKQPTGILPQLMTSVGDAAGVPLKFSLVPYQRIFTRGRRQTHDLGLIYDVSYKEKRDSPLDLSCIEQPVIRSRLYIYGFRRSTKAQPTLASFSSISLEEDRYQLPKIDGKALQVVGLSNAEAIFKSLVSGRVDYAVSSELLRHYWQRKLATPPMIAFASMGKVEGYLCYPKSLPVSASVGKLKSYMEQLNRDDFSGFINQLLRHYDLPQTLDDRFLPAASARSYDTPTLRYGS